MVHRARAHRPDVHALNRGKRGAILGVMDARTLAENALTLPRFVQTVRAARQFDRARPTPRATDGASKFRMRSVMDLDPRIGKAISKLAIKDPGAMAWQTADPSTSRFVDATEIDAAVASLHKDGFYVFQHVVDRSLTDTIRTYAEQAPCLPRGVDGPPVTYPRAAPSVGRYDFDEDVALGCPTVQEFVTDPAMAVIAQRYLGQPVLMDEVAFWWTTNKRAEDANINAQMFHQDRDRLSFLKFFIYLTDVTPDTGPHVYVRGSHRNVPWALRADGRITDEAVQKAGLGHEITELCGPAGTLLAVDTIGLHKGKTPITSDRLALENEFATSLFGMDYERPSFTPTDLTKDRYMSMPWVLQRYRDAVVG